MDGFQLVYQIILNRILYNIIVLKLSYIYINKNYKMSELTDEQVMALNILIQALIKGKRFRLYNDREWNILQSMLAYLEW